MAKREQNHWLRARLDELPGKDGAGLARAMGVAKQRVYEIYKPPKRTRKPRRFKVAELQRAANYLEWDLGTLMAHIEGRAFDPARHGTEIGRDEIAKIVEPPRRLPVMLRAAQAERGGREGFMLAGEIAAPLLGATVAAGTAFGSFSFKIVNSKYEPVYRLRDELVVDPSYEVIVGEDCLFTSADWTTTGGFCVLARLQRDDGNGLWICRVIGKDEEFSLPKAEFPNAWAITERHRPK